MKCLLPGIFVLLIAAGFCSSVYGESSPPAFVARLHRTLVSQNTGMHFSCVVVHEDGRYRLEDSQQDLMPGVRPTMKIYLDSLPEPAMKRLREIVDDKAFLEIKSPVHNDQILNVFDQLSVTVPRKEGMQEFSFLDPDSRKPYDKILKPLLEWFREVQKRKLPPQKGAVSNRCAD
ncbi:MAG: hypothetical protein WAQ52_18710 [Terriglobales bacterium]